MPAFPHSNVLLISADAVHSLLPPTLISQIGALLELHKIKQAAALAEQYRKRLNRDPSVVDSVEVRPNVRLRTFCFHFLRSTGPRATFCLPTNRFHLPTRYLVRR